MLMETYIPVINWKKIDICKFSSEIDSFSMLREYFLEVNIFELERETWTFIQFTVHFPGK